MRKINEECLAINRVTDEAHDIAMEHGFYEDQEALEEYLLLKADRPDLANIAHRNFVLAQLAKISSEVGESVAVVQKIADYSGLGEELADIAIRTMDLAAYLGYQHGTNIMLKMAKNANRPYKHGKIC
jgi:NTP pyrophosphatase (non-canonical NTP hydrolase)